MRSEVSPSARAVGNMELVIKERLWCCRMNGECSSSSVFLPFLSVNDLYRLLFPGVL